jgi:hypothetical protein
MKVRIVKLGMVFLSGLLVLNLLVSQAVGQAKGEKGRFTVSKEEIITDNLTGLEWYVGPDQDTNWYQARAWVQGLKVGGGGWRLPIRDELKSLYIKDKVPSDVGWFFKTTGGYIWSGESSAWRCGFGGGSEYYRRDYSRDRRAFAVRSPR